MFGTPMTSVRTGGPNACPACSIPLPPQAADCPACGLVQAGRLAYLMAELESYLADARNRRAAPGVPVSPATQPPVAKQPATNPPATQPPVAKPPLPRTPMSPMPPMPAVAAGPGVPPVVRRAEPVPSRLRGLSPQALLLGLGVLLVLAAGATFLAVTWNTLPLSIQAAIMGALAVVVLAASVPASRHRLTGTAEAFAVLGIGLLAVDLYGARARGLIPADSTDGATYLGLASAVVAIACLTMLRLTAGVTTFGVAAVLAAQVPLAALLADRVDLALLGLVVLGQAVATTYLTYRAAAAVRVAGAVCAFLGYLAVVQVAPARALLGLVPDPPGIGPGDGRAAAAVALLAAVVGVIVLRRGWLAPRPAAPVGECVCATVAGLAVAAGVAGLPFGGTWLVTALAVVITVAELVRPAHRADRVLRPMVLMAGAAVAAVDLGLCLTFSDLRQLAAIALLTGALAVLAHSRGRIGAPVATGVAFAAPTAALMFASADGIIAAWPAGLAGSAVAAAAIAFAGWRHGHPEEDVALVAAGAAAVNGFALATTAETAALTAVGIVLVISGAPLLAYGRLPGRRPALLVAVAVLTVANGLLAGDAGAGTLELYTVPPALLMLAVGLNGWRSSPSWVRIGPGLLVGLLPSSTVAIASDDPVRLAGAVAVALVAILLGVRYSLQAPFLIGVGVLAKVGIWQLVLVAPEIPRWITLGVAGAVLLGMGATYEKRINEARQAVRWVGQLR